MIPARTLTTSLFVFAALAGPTAAMVQTAPPSSQAAPPVAPTAPPALALRNPPTVIHETTLLEPPSPTASPTFGTAVTFAGDQAIVTGPVMSRGSGFEGQIASFVEQSGSWSPNVEMPGVFGLRPMDAALQRVRGAPGFFATNIDRKSAQRSEVMVFTAEKSAAGWRHTATLTTPGGEAAPGFGTAIATDGTFIICSDVDTRVRPGKPEELPPAPGVHVFARNGEGAWERASVLRRDPARVSTWFGAALSTDGARLAIGSPRATQPVAGDPLRLADAAVVEIRRRDGANWPVEAELNGASCTEWPGFGVNVAIDGDVLAVRALEIVNGGTGVKVFVFRRKDGKWMPDGELTPHGTMPSLGFGTSLAVADGRILVSDTHANIPGESLRGVVHGFERVGDAWQETFRLLPQAACRPRSFGASFAVSGDRVLVGRVRSEDAGVPNGGAFLFQLPARAKQP